MSNKLKQIFFSAALIPFLASIGRADNMVTYHMTADISKTLENLGTKFVAGCMVLALGIVVAAAISRRN